MKWNTIAWMAPLFLGAVPLTALASEDEPVQETDVVEETQTYTDPIIQQMQQEADQIEDEAQSNLDVEQEQLDTLEEEKKALGVQTEPDDAALNQAIQKEVEAKDDSDQKQEELNDANDQLDLANEKHEEAKDDLESAKADLAELEAQDHSEQLKELVEEFMENDEKIDEDYSAFVEANNKVANSNASLKNSYEDFKTSVDLLTTDNLITNQYMIAILKETQTYTQDYQEFVDLIVQAAINQNEGKLDKDAVESYEHETQDYTEKLKEMSKELDAWKKDFLTYTNASHTVGTEALEKGDVYLSSLQASSRNENAIQTTQNLLKTIQNADDYLMQHPDLIKDVLTLSDQNMKRVNAAAQVKWETFKVEVAQKAVNQANENVQTATQNRDEAQSTYDLAQKKTKKEQELYDEALLSYNNWLKAMEEINQRIEVQKGKVEEAASFLAYAKEVAADTSMDILLYREDPWYAKYNALLDEYYRLNTLPDDIPVDDTNTEDQITTLPDSVLIIDEEITTLPDDVLIVDEEIVTLPDEILIIEEEEVILPDDALIIETEEVIDKNKNETVNTASSFGLLGWIGLLIASLGAFFKIRPQVK
jgi:hypothetical protein